MISNELSEIEALTARGLTNADIAAALGLRATDVDGSLAKPLKRDAIDRYHQDCIGRALADPYPDEAAEYLYVRSVPKRVIVKVGLIRRHHEFDGTTREKKTRYQARQLELARTRLAAGRLR